MCCAGLLEVQRAEHEGRNIADLAGRSHRVEAFPVLFCFAEICLGQRLLSYRTCPALCHFEPLIFQGYGAFGKRGKLANPFFPMLRDGQKGGASRALWAFRVMMVPYGRPPHPRSTINGHR